MRKTLIILLLLVSFISCKKSSDDGNYTITVLVLDYDTKTPIPGATALAKTIYSSSEPWDSLITDVNGRAVFRYKVTGNRKMTYSLKNGYLNPNIIVQNSLSETNRIDTNYLVRPSLVSLLVHKTGSYLSGDSIEVKMKGFYAPQYYVTYFASVFKRLANTTDTSMNVYCFYFNPDGRKLYFQWEIIRNNTVISTQNDSSNLIQYGTKSYTLNY